MSLSSRSMSKIGDNLFSYKIEKFKNYQPHSHLVLQSGTGRRELWERGRKNKLQHSKDKQTNKQHPQNEREEWEKVK